MAAWNTWKLLRDEFVKRLKYGVRIMAGQKSDLAGEAEAVRVDTGRVETIEKLSVAGATPTAKVGTTGRLPATKTITFNAATAMVGTYRPKGGGVTVATVLGGGHSVAVLGRAITVTVQVGVTTKANLDADWAASAAALALAEFTCTAGTVGAGYLAETITLEDAGTIPLGAAMALWPDGYWRPAEVDSTGGLKTSASSLHYGEGDTVPQLRVQQRGMYGTALAASGTTIAVPCNLTGVAYSVTVGGVVDVRDGGAGGAIKMSYTLPVGAGLIPIFAAHGTDVYLTYNAPLAGALCGIYAPTT